MFHLNFCFIFSSTCSNLNSKSSFKTEKNESILHNSNFLFFLFSHSFEIHLFFIFSKIVLQVLKDSCFYPFINLCSLPTLAYISLKFENSVEHELQKCKIPQKLQIFLNINKFSTKFKTNFFSVNFYLFSQLKTVVTFLLFMKRFKFGFVNFKFHFFSIFSTSWYTY